MEIGIIQIGNRIIDVTTQNVFTITQIVTTYFCGDPAYIAIQDNSREEFLFTRRALDAVLHSPVTKKDYKHFIFMEE